MKPIDELITLTQDEKAVAPKLGLYPETVVQWRERERELPDGRIIIERGPEPSAGFIACALAILRG